MFCSPKITLSQKFNVKKFNLKYIQHKSMTKVEASTELRDLQSFLVSVS